MSPPRFHHLALAGAVFALAVVVLGAYVRLAGAGLGCPDWPGCYGHLTVPEAGAPETAEYDRSLEPAKAWKEMLHRYLAGTLGLVVFALAAWAWRRRRMPGQPVKTPLFLVALVVFQALLGMWTVTWLLKPVVVTAHLLGGMATLSLLFWLGLNPGKQGNAQARAPALWQRWTALALAVVAIQIALGGWTSANYAALACPDFPTCRGQWWPPMDFAEAFVLWRGLGIDYEGGVLGQAALTAIHWSHRLGAVITLLVVAPLSFALLRRGSGTGLRTAAGLAGLLLLGQIGLGIANVALGLPLPLAAAHNGVAALLLLALVGMYHCLRAGGSPAGQGGDEAPSVAGDSP